MRKILLILALFLSFSVTAQNSRYYPVIMMMGQSSCDADALAFISAAGITDATEKVAICQLVLDLKFYSLWTKMQAIYPMVGGTATTTKYNLKDPRDLDAAFRIVWSGGITYASTGVTGNGTTGMGNTNYNPNTSGSLNSQHLSYYSRTDQIRNEAEIGYFNGSSWCALYCSYSGTHYTLINTATITSVAVANSSGFFVANRTASNLTNGWRNSTKIVETADASSVLVNSGLSILASAGGLFSTKECAFATIGTGLTDTDNANLYTVVQAFQTTLGR